jgi:hypothetical protein
MKIKKIVFTIDGPPRKDELTNDGLTIRLNGRKPRIRAKLIFINL